MHSAPRIKSVRTVFELVEYLADRQAVGVSEAARDLEMPKSTVHDYLQSLETLGFVVRGSQGYELGSQLLYLGASNREANRFYREARPMVERLAEETGEYASVVVEEHGRAVLLDTVAGEESVRISTLPGLRMKMHMTSPGKAFLASMDDEEVEAVVDRHGLEAMTPNTITSRERLSEELATVRERGFALEDEERIVGLRSVAVPVSATDGGTLGVLTVYGPKHRIDDERFEATIPDRLLKYSNIIEINTNYD